MAVRKLAGQTARLRFQWPKLVVKRSSHALRLPEVQLVPQRISAAHSLQLQSKQSPLGRSTPCESLEIRMPAHKEALDPSGCCDHLSMLPQTDSVGYASSSEPENDGSRLGSTGATALRQLRDRVVTCCCANTALKDPLVA